MLPDYIVFFKSSKVICSQNRSETSCFFHNLSWFSLKSFNKNRQVKNSQTAWYEKYISLIRSTTKRWFARYKHEKYRFRNMSVFWLIYMRMAYESVTTKSGYPSLLTYKLFILETNTYSLLPYLRMQWSVIFAVAICCSGLRLRVGYFTYFKVTHVFF